MIMIFLFPFMLCTLSNGAPVILPYLGLAPGWRFLLAGDYADVWEDIALLEM